MTSERVATLNWAEEVFYRRLMSVVDDYGRYTANTKLIRAACYPLVVDKVSDSDINKWIAKCAEAGLVSVYSVSADADDQKGSPRCGKPAGVSRSLQKQYIQLHNFRQQTRTTVSKYPAMPIECESVTSTCVADASQTTSTCVADDKHMSTLFVYGDEDEDEDVKKSKPKKVSPETAEFTLPDWINQAHWEAWRSHPKLKNATAKQKAVAVEKLRKWRDAGEDYAGALENAAVSGYQGLFLPDNSKRKQPKQTESFREHDDRIAKERWEQLTGQKHPDLHQKHSANIIDITPAAFERIA